MTTHHPPQITVTFVNGVEEVFDATSTPAQTIRNMILEKGQILETEQMFREAGEKWPVVIPEEELLQPAPGTKVCVIVYLFEYEIDSLSNFFLHLVLALQLFV